MVILRRSRFPSRHGDTDLVRYIYPYVRAVLALVAGGRQDTTVRRQVRKGTGWDLTPNTNLSWPTRNQRGPRNS